jgi:hypothetical protein
MPPKKPIRVANQTPQPFTAGPGSTPGVGGGGMGMDPYQSQFSMDQSMPSLVPTEMPGVPTGQRRIMKRGARKATKGAKRPPKAMRGSSGAPGMKPTGSSIAF